MRTCPLGLLPIDCWVNFFFFGYFTRLGFLLFFSSLIDCLFCLFSVACLVLLLLVMYFSGFFLCLSSVIIINAMMQCLFLQSEHALYKLGCRFCTLSWYPCILVSRLLGFQLKFRLSDRLFHSKTDCSQRYWYQGPIINTPIIPACPGPKPWYLVCLNCSWLWHTRHGLLCCWRLLGK